MRVAATWPSPPTGGTALEGMQQAKSDRDRRRAVSAECRSGAAELELAAHVFEAERLQQDRALSLLDRSGPQRLIAALRRHREDARGVSRRQADGKASSHVERLVCAALIELGIA